MTIIILMKHTLLCMILCFATFASAQTVNIPNVAFKDKLLNAATTNMTAKDATGNSMVIDINNDNEIQYSEALAVYQLRVTGEAIDNVQGLEAFTNLTLLSLNFTTLTSLDVSPLTGLINLNVSGNDLTSVILSGLGDLEILDVSDNNFTQLNLTALSSLTSLYCEYNNLTVLDLSDTISLTQLFCQDNQLSLLNLSAVDLNFLVCSNNPLLELDLSGQSGIDTLSLFGCSSLTALYLKNGNIDNINVETFSDCPNLELICVDEEELQLTLDVIAQMQQWNPINATVTTFCPAPGGNNTITGVIAYASDGGDCTTSTPIDGFISMIVSDGENQGTIYDSNGAYNIDTQEGIYTLTPQFNEALFIAFPPSATVPFNMPSGSAVTQNFCLTPNGIHPDVEVIILPIIPARPGFDAYYQVLYRNTGNQALSGTVTFTYVDAVQDYISATPAEAISAAGTITWNYNDLMPFENRIITVILNTNSPVEVPAVNIDDVLLLSAVVTSDNGDENLTNNTFQFEQVVVGSFDPNNIICAEGGTEPADAIGDYLHYIINFENIGTSAAEFVVVTNEIDASKYDINSLEILSTSHDADITVEGNTIEFRFNDINLEPAVYGNVSYKIKTKTNLTVGDVANNQAIIVFDFNEPLATNEAATVFAALGTQAFVVNNIAIYPNPTTGRINISSKDTLQSFILYDLQGRLLQSTSLNYTAHTIDISAYPSGIYLLEIKTDAGINVERIVKK